MTVKELIDRLNELNSPDKEVVIGDCIPIKGASFSDVGDKIVITPFLNIKKIQYLISDLRDNYYDIEGALDDIADTLGDLADTISEIEELI